MNFSVCKQKEKHAVYKEENVKQVLVRSSRNTTVLDVNAKLKAIPASTQKEILLNIYKNQQIIIQWDITVSLIGRITGSIEVNEIASPDQC